MVRIKSLFIIGILITAFALLFTSCEKDDSEPDGDSGGDGNPQECKIDWSFVSEKDTGTWISHSTYSLTNDGTSIEDTLENDRTTLSITKDTIKFYEGLDHFITDPVLGCQGNAIEVIGVVSNPPDGDTTIHRMNVDILKASEGFNTDTLKVKRLYHDVGGFIRIYTR